MRKINTNHKAYLLLITFIFGIVINLGNLSIPMHTENIHSGFIGLYFASTGIGLFLFATLWGSLGDIKDRNKILGLTFIGFSIGQLVFGLVINQYSLLLGSLISGVFTSGFLVNVYAYINDNYDITRERDKILSYAVSLTIAGSSIGYLIGGFLTQIVAPNYGLTFIIQSILALLFGLFIFLEKTDLVDTDHHLSRRHFWLNIKQIGKLPWLPIATITLTFFISFSHNNVKRFFDVFATDSGYKSSSIGIIVFVTGIVALFANMILTPFLLKYFHNLRLLMLLFLFVPISLFFTFYNGMTILKVFSLFMVYHLFMAIYEPTAISLMSSNRTVPQGVVVGVRQSIVGFGMTVGFIVGGQLYEFNSTNVFYFAVLFYIIVFVGFIVLNVILSKDIKEYRGGFTHD